MTKSVPPGWEETTLGEVGRWSSGGTPSRRTPEYYGGDIPWVKTGELRDCRIASTGEHITEAGLANSSAKLFPPDTLLVAMYGATIGQTGILDVPAATNQACAALIPENGTSELIPYLFHYVCSQREKLKAAGQGGAQPNISQGLLKEYAVPVAPLNEQRRIVAKIESLFERSRRAKKALDAIPPLLDKLRQSILAAAFRGDLTADWRAHNPDVEPADKLLERIRVERRHRWEQAQLAKMRAKGKEPKNDKWKAKYLEPEPLDAGNLPQLPSGWRWCALEELAVHKSGVSYKSTQFVSSGVQVIKLGNLYQGRFDLSRDPAFLPPSHPQLEVGRVDPGDILVSQTGTRHKRDYGHFVVVPDGSPALVLNQRVLSVQAAPSVPPEWLRLASKLPNYRSHFFGQETGGVNQGNVGIAGVMRGPIPIAPAAELDRCLSALTVAMRAVRSIEARVAGATGTTDSLQAATLASAFRGELVDQDPNDETASVLLERIRAAREAAKPVKKKRGRKRRVGGKKTAEV